jgi:hypothetical protein
MFIFAPLDNECQALTNYLQKGGPISQGNGLNPYAFSDV